MLFLDAFPPPSLFFPNLLLNTGTAPSWNQFGSHMQKYYPAVLFYYVCTVQN